MRIDPRSNATRTVLSHARGIINQATDTALGQMFNGSAFSGESHAKVPRVQNYGMTGNPLAPTGDWAAEAHMTYNGGGRSHPIVHTVDDRRHRARGMNQGEGFQHDDQGQGTLIQRVATHVIGGGYMGQEGAGGDPSSNFSTLRHVLKMPQPGGIGGGSSLLETAEVLTPSGFKNVAELRPGDAVISYNHKLKKDEIDSIRVAKSESSKKKISEVKFSDGGILRSTSDHLFWAEEERYISASRLAIGYTVTISETETRIVESVVTELPAKQPKVFSLGVTRNRNLYARERGSQTPVLVHNDSGGQSSGGGYDHSGGDSPTSEYASLNGSAETTGQKQIMHTVGQATQHIDTKHSQLAFGKGNTIWADENGVWSSKPIQVKPYPYSVSAVKRPQNSGTQGSGGSGGSGGGQSSIFDEDMLDVTMPRRQRPGTLSVKWQPFIMGMIVLIAVYSVAVAQPWRGADAQTDHQRIAFLEQRVGQLEQQVEGLVHLHALEHPENAGH